MESCTSLARSFGLWIFCMMPTIKTGQHTVPTDFQPILSRQSYKLGSAACEFFSPWGQTRVPAYSHVHVELTLMSLFAITMPVLHCYWTMESNSDIFLGLMWRTSVSQMSLLKWSCNFDQPDKDAVAWLSPCRAKKILCSNGCKLERKWHTDDPTKERIILFTTSPKDWRCGPWGLMPVPPKARFTKAGGYFHPRKLTSPATRCLQLPSHHLLSVIPQDAMDSTTPRANHKQKTDGSDSCGNKKLMQKAHVKKIRYDSESFYVRHALNYWCCLHASFLVDLAAPLPAVLSWQAFKQTDPESRPACHVTSCGWRGCCLQSHPSGWGHSDPLPRRRTLPWNFPRFGVCTGPGNDWSAPGFPSDPYHERPPSPPGTCHLAEGEKKKLHLDQVQVT